MTFLSRASLLAVMAVVLLGSPLAAEAKRDRDRPKVRGIVESRPEGGIGEWVVDGRVFVADGRTELDTDEGPLVVGACVKVRYALVDGRAVALEIDSEPPHDCARARVPAAR